MRLQALSAARLDVKIEPQNLEDYEEELKDLTPRQRIFISYYVQCFNGKQAALQAGIAHTVGSAYVASSTILKEPKVKKFINSFLAGASANAQEVVYHVSQVARYGDVSHFLGTDEHGNVKIELNTERAKRAVKLLKKVKQTTKETVNLETNEKVTETTVEIEVYSKLDAASILLRHYDSLPPIPSDMQLAEESKPLYIVVNAQPTKQTTDNDTTKETPTAL